MYVQYKEIHMDDYSNLSVAFLQIHKPKTNPEPHLRQSVANSGGSIGHNKKNHGRG